VVLLALGPVLEAVSPRVVLVVTGAAGSPLLLPPALRDTWADPALTDPAQVADLVKAVPPPGLVPVRVSARVGDPRHDRPDLIAPLDI
jgi:putative SOS response-associated peptidase YedK